MGNKVQFIIELTNSCNFSCKYCYLAQASSLKHENIRKMSLETGLDVIKFLFYDVYQNGEPLIFVDFLDGEPLLNYEVLREMVSLGADYEKQAGQKVFVFRFTTNGSYLNDDIIQFAAEHSIYFNISVDGIPESHDLNRVYSNGAGTSVDVHNKLNLVAGLENVGVVATYSPNTYHFMDAGIAYFMDRGIKNIEINFSMGYGKYTDIDRLIHIFKRNIDIYLSNYAQGDFSHTYVILDNVLRKLFSRYTEPSQCAFPFKIAFDGSVLSCDRIPTESNKVLSTIYNGRFDPRKLMSKHFCVKRESVICQGCNYRILCTPCYMYLKESFVEEDGRPMFCHVMQAIITKAESFYEQHKEDVNLAIQFDMELREKILRNEYEIASV